MFKNKNTDNQFLRDQYRDASNLTARMELHRRFGTNSYGWHRWVFDHFELPSQAQILELGCGPGTLWLENVERIPGDWTITLSDLSLGMLQEAQQNLRGSGKDFAFEQVDAQAIPFADASFDAVVANHMLYHVPDRAKAYAEIQRVLRPGGGFYATTNGQKHMHELLALLDRFNPNPSVGGGLGFNLENGQDELSRWFAAVTLHCYPSALVVTEVEPLVAYVLSAPPQDFLVGNTLTQFMELVEQAIAQHGAFHITQGFGLFEAVRDHKD